METRHSKFGVFALCCEICQYIGYGSYDYGRSEMIHSKTKQGEDSEDYYNPNDKPQSKKTSGTGTKKQCNDNKQYYQIYDHLILLKGTPSVRKRFSGPFDSTRMKTYGINIPLFSRKYNGDSPW